MKSFLVNKINLYFFIIGFVLIIIAGFRPIGIDHDSLNYFSVISNPNYQINLLSKSPTFWIIYKSIYLFFDGSIRSFFIIYAVIGVTLKLYVIKKISHFPLLSLLSYISFFFILQEMTAIRAGVATALLYISVFYIIDKQFFKFLFIVLVAVLFHYSAIIFLPMYFIVNKIKNKYLFAVLPLFGLFIHLSNFGLFFIKKLTFYLPDFLSYKLHIYFNLLTENKITHISPFTLGNVLLLLIFYINLFKINFKENKLDIILIKLLSIGFFLLFGLSFLPVFAYRLSNFFFFSIIFLIPNVLLFFKQKKLILILILIYFGYTFIKNCYLLLNF